MAWGLAREEHTARKVLLLLLLILITVDDVYVWTNLKILLIDPVLVGVYQSMIIHFTQIIIVSNLNFRMIYYKFVTSNKFLRREHI